MQINNGLHQNYTDHLAQNIKEYSNSYAIFDVEHQATILKNVWQDNCNTLQGIYYMVQRVVWIFMFDGFRDD